MFDRPPPDPVKLLDHLAQWHRGEVTAGRAVADLKIAGLGDVLAALPGRDDLRDPWQRWERGTEGPAALLDALDAAGVVPVLEGLAAALPTPG